MRYFKHFLSANLRDEARMYPRLDPHQVVKADRPSDLPIPEGECRLLVVLLNPGSGPSCEVGHFPAWVESPIKKKHPTNRNVAQLVADYAQASNWEPTHYARIACLFQTTGTDRETAFDEVAEPKFHFVAQLAHPNDVPVVFGWGGFNPQGHLDYQRFLATRTCFIENFPSAVGAKYDSNPRGFTPIAPGYFVGEQALTPAHPAVRHGGWSNAVLEALNQL